MPAYCVPLLDWLQCRAEFFGYAEVLVAKTFTILIPILLETSNV